MQSAIHKEVIKVLEKEYKAEQEMLKNEFRQIIDESIKDAFEKLEKSIKENTRQLKELQDHIQGTAKLLPKEGDKTPQTGSSKAIIPDKHRKKSIKHYFLQLQKRPVMPILAAAFLAFMSFVIYVTLFSDMSPDKEAVQVSDKQAEKTVTDLKTEHETYAKALSHIAKTPSAPEHLKLKELIKKISTADGTNNSIISEPQKERFAEFVNQSQIPWDFSVIGFGLFEYIAAINCKLSSCKDEIKIDLQIGDITKDILTALNQSLPKSVRLKSVPQKYKENKKASGFTEDFKEFMAAVVLAHIVQKDEKP